MRKFILFTLLIFCLGKLNAQETKSNPYEDKYDDKEFNGLKVTKVIEASGFKAVNYADLRQFKSMILQLSQRAYTQLNIDTWYLCSYKHEEYFLIYNMYYKSVTHSFYDENCKALITLMILDGTVKQPK